VKEQSVEGVRNIEDATRRVWEPHQLVDFIYSCREWERNPGRCSALSSVGQVTIRTYSEEGVKLTRG
jgi:hypothetical protein